MPTPVPVAAEPEAPPPPPPVDTSEKYVDEMHDTVHEVAARLKALANDPRLPKWAQKEASGAHMQLTNSTGFIAEQFAEAEAGFGGPGA